LVQPPAVLREPLSAWLALDRLLGVRPWVLGFHWAIHSVQNSIRALTPCQPQSSQKDVVAQQRLL
ncbi:hypothetical protein NEUTE1DRAFT_39662, partial [Neurospora tetrasperma FGSC 2508]